MAKFRDIAKGTKAVKPVPFRAANAPLLKPGEEADEHTVMVGVRILNGIETAAVFEQAQSKALAAGVPQWLDTHPLCRLYEMAFTVALSCVDVDSGDRVEPFFVSVDEVLSAPELGPDNIAYLYQQQRFWQDECSPRDAPKTPAQLAAWVAEEAARPENSPDSPFSRFRPSSQQSLVHSMAVQLWKLLAASSAYSSMGEQSSSESSTLSEKPTSSDEKNPKSEP
jgi:hypothetical protein